MMSLRRRLLAVTAAVTSVVLAALGIILFFSVRAWLLQELDRALLAQAQVLATRVQLRRGHVEMDFDGVPPSDFSPGRRADYFELWNADQQPLERSLSLASADLPAIPSSNRPAYRFVRLPTGRLGRGITLTVQPRSFGPATAPGVSSRPAPRPVTLQVARDISEVWWAMDGLSWLLWCGCGAAVLLCLGLMFVVIRRGLRPLSDVAARISRLGLADLSDRIDVADAPAELAPVIQRLNDLLARLQAAFAREKAFSADVSHELRTPLAGLEMALEVCASRPRQPAEYQAVVAQCLQAVRQMHGMVDNLLVLARADAGALVLSPGEVQLGRLIEECWSPLREQAEGRALHFDIRSDEGGTIVTDRQTLQLVLSNLFDNAVNYADDGGQVRLSCARDNGEVHLNLTNTGSRVSSDQAAHVFDRFWRGDSDRRETGSHCGLGLSLCRQLVLLLGGTIAVESSDGGEFRVRLTLPREPVTSKPPLL